MAKVVTSEVLVTLNKVGYTAQDAPSMHSFHLGKKHGTDIRIDRRTDTTSYRDATAFEINTRQTDARALL